MRARHGSRFVLGLLLGIVACTARATTVEITVAEIPTPRPAGWTVDLTGTLPAERLAELNQLGDQIKAKTGAEMAVVVVSSTGGVDAHEFATRLFNAWGIGERGKENGLLVFAALADHKAEIVLGMGLDGETGRRESEAVMQGEIVPRFRAGNPSGAIVLGAIACARRILGVSPISTGLESTPETALSPVPAPQPEPAPYTSPETPPQPPSQTPESVYETSSGRTGGSGLIWMGALGALLLVFGFIRYRAPRCPKCKQKMTKLDEQADDAYLESAEKVEERVGSVDHLIWECPACGERVKGRRTAFFSGYGTCPECSARTLSSSSRTVEEATYSHGGLIETEEICANCSYQNRYTRETARREEPVSSPSSSSSSSASRPSYSLSSGASSSSSSSSSSSDSSSGSSSSSGYSGGSSSGGGASGSW
jgi:uncharacterized protein